MSSVREWLKQTAKINDSGYQVTRPRIVCNDGFSISVQGSSVHNCSPKRNLQNGDYWRVEAGYPNRVEELLLDYAYNRDEPMDTWYSLVPVDLVQEIVDKHGGMV